MKIEKDAIGLLVFLLAGLCFGGGYFTARHYTFKEAYAKGISQGQSEYSNELKQVGGNYIDELNKNYQLQAQYNNETDSYNTLRSAVLKYLSPQQMNALTCKSMTYGINNQFTSTTCN